MNENCHRTKSFCSVTLSYRLQLATDFGFSGSLFSQVQSGPPSLKTQCHKKRKPAFNMSTWGRPLSSPDAPKLNVYHNGDA